MIGLCGDHDLEQNLYYVQCALCIVFGNSGKEQKSIWTFLYKVKKPGQYALVHVWNMTSFEMIWMTWCCMVVLRKTFVQDEDCF